MISPVQSARSCFGSLVGMLIGGVLLIAAFPVLIWNENQLITDQKTVAWARTAVVEGTPETAAFGTNGKLVHMVGVATTQQSVTEPLFHITAHALKIRRNVQMYQWVESEHSHDDHTTYSYSQQWVDHYVDSSAFHYSSDHHNRRGKYQANTVSASTMNLGAFALCPALMDRIDNFVPMPAPEGYDLPDSMLDAGVKATGGMDQQGRTTVAVYVGRDPDRPQIGDEKMDLTYILPETVSVIAQQSGTQLLSGQAPTGESVSLLYVGDHSAADVLRMKAKEDTIRAWAFRGLGWLMMTFGLFLLSSPVLNIVGAIPFIGGIVEAGGCLVSVLLAAALTTVTSAGAWLFFRPGVSIAIILTTLAVLALIGRFSKRRST